MRRALLFLVVLAAVLIVAPAPTRAASSPTGGAWTHPAGALPVVGLSGQPSSVQPVYDEQLGMTFTQGFSKLSYNVTAVAQSDAQGYGPGYLLNGLTDGGFWYQVGVAFDWPYQGGGYEAGFNFLYEAFNSSGASLFPSGGGGGLDNFSGRVNDGDPVLIQLAFSGGNVVFLAHDWKTGVTATQSFAAVGTHFVGLRFASSDHGFFTGLMTEWYHVDPYYGSEAEVTYSNPTTQLTSATLWADEFNANDSSSLFGSSQSYTFSNPDQLRLFSLNGATEHADAYLFITGSLGKTPVTLSYSVTGGGTGFGSPLLSYISNGVSQTAALSGTPTTYLADNGSRWQVSADLPGGSAFERWETVQATNGTLTRPVTESIFYFHQYLCDFAYRVVGGGSGYSPPQGETTEFGSALTLSGNASAWVDAGSSFQYPASLTGSTATERWATSNDSWAIDGPQSVLEPYFHQVSLNFSYRLVGGGSPEGPTLSGIRFGNHFTLPLSNASSYSLDQGTGWSLPSLLAGGGSQERWFAARDTNGSAVETQSVVVDYDHQYVVSAGSAMEAGGSASVQVSWVGAGSNVEISETANAGWRFEGWAGSGIGSYSGPLGATYILVSGPVRETATFYPGLTLLAGENGAITYTSATANGTVPAGGSTTIYQPPGSTVSLRAAPSSPLYTFAGWSPSAGDGAALRVTVDSPETVSATFQLSLFTLAGLGAVVAAVAGGVYLRTRRRGATARIPPAFNPPNSPP